VNESLVKLQVQQVKGVVELRIPIPGGDESNTQVLVVDLTPTEAKTVGLALLQGAVRAAWHLLRRAL
jgi:hypothetical protein